MAARSARLFPQRNKRTVRRNSPDAATANVGEAFAWYRKAADAGCPEAQYNQGVGYIFGRGVAHEAARASQDRRRIYTHATPGRRKPHQGLLAVFKRRKPLRAPLLRRLFVLV